ncbi:hypothetical protein PG984_010452 [Apiospora sp. TS-2023a]
MVTPQRPAEVVVPRLREQRHVARLGWVAAPQRDDEGADGSRDERVDGYGIEQHGRRGGAEAPARQPRGPAGFPAALFFVQAPLNQELFEDEVQDFVGEIENVDGGSCLLAAALGIVVMAGRDFLGEMQRAQ